MSEAELKDKITEDYVMVSDHFSHKYNINIDDILDMEDQKVITEFIRKVVHYASENISEGIKDYFLYGIGDDGK